MRKYLTDKTSLVYRTSSNYKVNEKNKLTSSPSVVTLSWQQSCTNKMTYKPSKLGQSGQFCLWSQFISTYTVLMIRATLVNR